MFKGDINVEEMLTDMDMLKARLQGNNYKNPRRCSRYD